MSNVNSWIWLALYLKQLSTWPSTWTLIILKEYHSIHFQTCILQLIQPCRPTWGSISTSSYVSPNHMAWIFSSRKIMPNYAIDVVNNGAAKFPLKIQNNLIFSVRIKDGMVFYLLWVKSMLGSGPISTAPLSCLPAVTIWVSFGQFDCS